MYNKSWLLIAALAIGVGGSWLLTKLVRNHALARSILDHPTDRGLHSTATPRGGGMAIVIITLASVVVAAATGFLGWRFTIAAGVGGAAIAFVGWHDDVSSMSAISRLFVHSAAAIWAVHWLGGMPQLSVGSTMLSLGPVGYVAAVIGIVWATNLFNFMDGSDGIVAVEVISVSAIGGGLLLVNGSVGLAYVALMLAASTLGFAWWNWAPARIFMGDVGSSFVGFMIAMLAVASENARSLPLAAWVLLSCVFLVDSTLTLFRRLRLGHWREPHRTHAYQVAIQGGWSHQAVATWVAGLNILLGALAVTSALGLLPLGPSLAIAAVGCGALYAAVVRRYKASTVSDSSN